jgi:HEAT repeat protein
MRAEALSWFEPTLLARSIVITQQFGVCDRAEKNLACEKMVGIGLACRWRRKGSLSHCSEEIVSPQRSNPHYLAAVIADNEWRDVPKARQSMSRFLFVVLFALFVLPLALSAQEAGKQPDLKTILKDKPLGKWIEDLKSSDVKVRSQAVQVLIQAGPAAKEAVPLLVANLKPGGWGWDENAFAILKIGGSAEQETAAVRLLLLAQQRCTPSALLSNRDFMKQHAGQIMPSLVSLLSDADVRCQTLAADGLAIYAGEARKFSPALVQGMKDKAPLVRIHAALALIKVDPGQMQQAIDAMLPLLGKSESGQAAQVLRELGAKAVPNLLPLLRQNTGEAQTPYILALVGVGEPAVAAMKKELTGPSAAGRVGAARVLGQLPYLAGSIHGDLLAALKDDNAEVRFYAAQALVLIDAGKAGPAVPNLIDALESRDLSIRLAAVAALTTLGKTAVAALPALHNALTNAEVQLPAALAMAAIDPKQAIDAVPVLSAELGRRPPRHTQEVLVALGKIGPAAAPAASAIRCSLEANDVFVRIRAASALVRVAPEHTAEAVTVLLNILDKKQALREALVALGEIGPPAKKAGPMLKTLLFDPKLKTHWIKKETMIALVKVDPSQAAPVVAQIKEDLKSKTKPIFFDAVEQLCQVAPAIPTESAPLLAELLNDKQAADDWDDIVHTLARLGPAAREVLPALKERLKDAPRDLADQINYAIGQINRPVKVISAGN